MAELCRCGHPLDAHSGTSVSGLPCTTCATQQLPPQRRCDGWAPPGSVALSYGCTCPGGDTHDPGNEGCRYGQVAAVRPDGRCGCSFSTLPGKELVCAEWERHQGPHQADGVTWPQLFPAHPVDRFPSVRGTRLDPDLDQAIHAATPVTPDEEAVEILRRFARDTVDWLKPRTPDGFVAPYSVIQVRVALLAGSDALEQLQATRDRLATLVEAARFADADAPEPWRSKSNAAHELRRAIAALDVAAAQENPQ